jgi:mevalonate kinase
MPAISASAPGKIILFGEHAVVYGRPAIAAPVRQIMAKAVIIANPKGSPGSVHIQAPAIGLDAELGDLPANHSLRLTIRNTLDSTGLSHLPACRLRITSTIPVASGLGSGAAVAVAVIKAVSSFTGRHLSDEEISQIAYETEKIHHGTPSGIDNSVVTFNRPIYYIKGNPIKLLRVRAPFSILIGNTGITSPTAATVGDLRRAWQADPERWEPYFDEIGSIANSAVELIERGRPERLGILMTRNHELLQDLSVSCNELDRLVSAALRAGALGAKLSGGGRGGNMIALVQPDQAPSIASGLMQAGATQTILTHIDGVADLQLQ